MLEGIQVWDHREGTLSRMGRGVGWGGWAGSCVGGAFPEGRNIL